jgi:hypothetical protein
MSILIWSVLKDSNFHASGYNFGYSTIIPIRLEISRHSFEYIRILNLEFGKRSRIIILNEKFFICNKLRNTNFFLTSYLTFSYHEYLLVWYQKANFVVQNCSPLSLFVLNIHDVRRRQFKYCINSKTPLSNFSQPLKKCDTLLKVT